jgi:hypothetical protein
MCWKDVVAQAIRDFFKSGPPRCRMLKIATFAG